METPADILRAAADLFEKRNEDYGSSYKQIGSVLFAMFPEGLTLLDEEDFTRFALFFMCAGKLDRYARRFAEGGQQDSTIDLSVYAAMLTEVDDCIRKENA